MNFKQEHFKIINKAYRAVVNKTATGEQKIIWKFVLAFLYVQGLIYHKEDGWQEKLLTVMKEKVFYDD